MKKMIILLMAVVLIVGMSAGVMAFTPSSDSVTVTIQTAKYASVDVVTDLFDVNGLFGHKTGTMLSGEPGLYVSDGNVTAQYTDGPGRAQWDSQGLDNTINLGASKLTVNDNNIEVVMVDANFDAEIELEWFSQDNWATNGLYGLIRTSTHEDIAAPNHGYIGTSSDDQRSYLASIASGIGTNWRDDNRDAQVHKLGDKDSFIVDAERCQGPYLYHLNGALFLSKADSIMADEDTTLTLQLTVVDPN